jgi:hypothetical protein
MQKSRWSLKAQAATLACAALTMAFATPAARAFDEDDMPDVKLFREILTGIGIRQDEKNIEYRERSPLVLPQNDALPPPETKSAADQATNWPLDQDVKRAREAKAARAHPKTLEDEDHVLSEQELTPGRRPGTPRRVSNTRGTTFEEGSATMTPSALGYVGGLFTSAFGGGNEPEAKRFKQEPPRTALTEPPPGYQTPSPAQPYGIGKAKDDGKFHDPMDWYGERGGEPQR